MKGGRQRKEQQLIHCGSDLLSQIFSFCDIFDIYNLLSSSQGLVQPIAGYLSAQKAISFSCLLVGFRNKIGNSDRAQQDAAVSRLVNLLLLLQETKKLNIVEHVEFSALRNLTGTAWLPILQNRCRSLRTLDFSGCASLDPTALVSFLDGGCHLARTSSSSSSSLRRLSLKGCVRAGTSVVSAIARRHTGLRSLSLGGCSQRIGIQDVLYLLERLPDLKDLDLQGLKRLKDPLLGALPSSIQSVDLTSCECLRLAGPESTRVWALHSLEGRCWTNVPASRHRVRHLVLDAIGTPRRGLMPGVLTYFALGRQLREVHLSGCEQVSDSEVLALAQLCGNTLTVLQMRACRIGNPALLALGTHCTCLAECDASACFQLSDDGVIALCRNRQLVRDGTNPKRRRHRSTLRSLKIASLPLLTDVALEGVSSLDSLLVLDMHDCPNVTARALFATMSKLRQLIDINAKGIKNDPLSILSLIRQFGSSCSIPSQLRFVDQRVLPLEPPAPPVARSVSSCPSSSCCTVRKFSQCLNPSTPPQYMYHCVDCGLTPPVNRGICASCASRCHKNHRTYLGSLTRFYCDCPFSIGRDFGSDDLPSSCQTIDL